LTLGIQGRYTGAVKRLVMLILSMMAVPAVARADVFSFKDLDGFEKCLATDHLLETVKTPDGTQERLLNQVDVQLRCIETAVPVLTAAKNKDLDLAFATAVKRMSAWENALDLLNVLVDHSLAGCNESLTFQVLLKALGRPKDTGRAGYVPRAQALARKCLKDKQFRADFMEEKDRQDHTLSANVCEVLRDEKLVKSCPGAH
jgi:hypothetical protein